MDTKLLLSFHDEIEGMVPVRAILLAGIAGDTIFENPGFFASADSGMFAACIVKVHLDVLALHDAVTCLTVLTELRIKDQFMHGDLLPRLSNSRIQEVYGMCSLQRH
jgi:hypothetical protein